MQINYKAFIEALHSEALRACRQCLRKVGKPGAEDRQGYFDALASAPMLIRCFCCLDRTDFDLEAAYSYFLDRVDESIDLVHAYRYSWDQHYEFARARGFYKVARLLNEMAAQMLHAEKRRRVYGI